MILTNSRQNSGSVDRLLFVLVIYSLRDAGSCASGTNGPPRLSYLLSFSIGRDVNGCIIITVDLHSLFISAVGFP